jgi:Glycosyltransferase
MFIRQGRSLVKAGYRVTYIVCDDQPDEVRDGIEILSTRFRPKGRLDRFLNTKKILFKLAKEEDADIYQISDPELIGLVKDFKKIGKKVVFNLREFYPDIIAKKPYFSQFVSKLIAWSYDKVLKLRLKEYDAVFTVTDWILDEVRNRYNVGHSYLLTNFPIIDRSFNLLYEDYLKRGDVLCYEGTIYSNSRQENVFKALEQVPKIKYLMAGKIEEKYEWIKKLPYWINVEFIDGFKIDDLPGIFGRSTISNVFRDFEGRDGSFGVMKVFESMEAGLPVLFADVPLYKSINVKYQCGICVDPNNVDSVRNAIQYMVEHKHEAYEMGQRGRMAIEQEYNWDTQAELFIKVINDILKE